jgi:hypothetical protein
LYDFIESLTFDEKEISLEQSNIIAELKQLQDIKSQETLGPFIAGKFCNCKNTNATARLMFLLLQIRISPKAFPQNWTPQFATFPPLQMDFNLTSTL